jgi:hypothetical protein
MCRDDDAGREVREGMTIKPVGMVMPSVQVYKHA